MLLTSLFADFVTIFVTIFVAELTDKDALLLLALATKIKPWVAFASGASAFTITTTIIVSAGYLLLQVVPVYAIKIAGGLIMIGYALFSYLREAREEKEAQRKGSRVIKSGKSSLSIFLGAVLMLCALDLAGDATEVLTIVYVAHFENLLLVFIGCVLALVTASAVETALGNRLGRVLSIQRIRIISLAIFLVIGLIVIITTIFTIPFLT